MKKLIISCVALLLLASCSQSFDADLLVDSPKEDKASFSMNPYYVDYETALQEAINFMSADNKTRAINRTFKVKNHYEFDATRRTRTIYTDSVDVLFHVINFENNAGFALVSADCRTTPIYAYSDSGYINLDDVVENTGFSEFMNGAITRYLSEVSNPDVGMLAKMRIRDFPIVDTTGMVTEIINGFPYLVDSHFETIESQDALLTTCWGQGDPYNYYCPIREINGTDTVRCLAGCVPIAISQILSKYRNPHTLYHYFNTSISYPLHWTLMMQNQLFPAGTRTIGALDVARLAVETGYRAAVHYGYDASWTTTADMTYVFNTLHYECSNLVSFDDSLARVSLGNEYPIFIAACLSGSTDGHAWVIDGFNRIQEIKSYYHTIYPFLLVMEVPTENVITYYHCNWGWDGDANGYYLDTFSVNAPCVSNSVLNFNTNVQMIHSIYKKTNIGPQFPL